MLEFLKTRQWIVARRVILIVIVLIVALNRYGGSLTSLLYRLRWCKAHIPETIQPTYGLELDEG